MTDFVDIPGLTPSREVREELVALNKAHNDAIDRRENYVAPGDAAMQKRLDDAKALDVATHTAWLEARRALDDAKLAIMKTAEVDPGYKAVCAAEDAAWQAYCDHECDPVLSDSGEFMRCALSGVIILYGDEYVEDPDTREVFLRAAAGLPPRPAEEADDDGADDEAAA